MHSIGIDMAKDTFEASFDDFFVRQFRNTELGINSFIALLSERGIDPAATTIGVEATGVYHLLFSAYLQRRGWRIVVINPLITNRMIKAGLRRVKTDKTDAIIIRKTVLAGEGYEYADTSRMLALKTLVSERSALVRMRAQIKQRMHVREMRKKAAFDTLHQSFSHTIQALSKDITGVERAMGKHDPKTQALLRSIPGIGKVSAAALVAFVGDIRRFSSPEKLVAYIGLDCRVHQSGTSIHGKGYITKRGNKYLRYILFAAAFRAVRANPELNAYFDKKLKEGKHHFSALCAVERKLVHLVYAVWKRGTPFERR